jgi:phosphoribosylaminoimidazole-succinocarboxamide synthase
VELVRSGKVRDVYRDGDDLILVASDRMSVYDVVLPTPVPEKGMILTQLSLWWFRLMTDIVPNHVLTEDVPDEWKGRAVRCQRLEMVPLECIVRGYLAGLGWDSYREQGSISGITLAPGYLIGTRLPEPIFTPSTKAQGGAHDEFVTIENSATLVGSRAEVSWLSDVSLRMYARAAEIAKAKGIIIADTKLEFGRDSRGDLVLADEIFTPDSSRFWREEHWVPGSVPVSYDKQFVRDWSASLTGWDRTHPGPEMPDDVVAETRRRYIWTYERLTGEKWGKS